MKAINIIITQALTLSVVLSTQAQGTFQNLNFEEANPISAGNPYPSYFVTTASALPYWTVTIGGVQQTAISYNDLSAGAPAVTLVGPPPPNPGMVPIDGNYSVVLQGSYPASFPSISQTGLIPAGTQSLLFEAVGGEVGQMNVLVGTQAVPFAAVGSGPNYTLYSANISAWAGQTEQLTFGVLESESAGQNDWEIDGISFSPTPEPSIVALTALGGLLFGARQWLARR